MQVCDASSILHAWDNYPVAQFPGMWEWVAIEIEEGRLAMSVVAVDEVQHKYQVCGEWLKAHNLKVLPVTNSIIQEARRTSGLIGIVQGRFLGGVDENDLIIIATAKEHGAELISEEARQKNLPTVLANCKIPAVCAMSSVSVHCINFVEYIKRSNAIFR